MKIQELIEKIMKAKTEKSLDALSLLKGRCFFSYCDDNDCYDDPKDPGIEYVIDELITYRKVQLGFIRSLNDMISEETSDGIEVAVPDEHQPKRVSYSINLIHEKSNRFIIAEDRDGTRHSLVLYVHKGPKEWTLYLDIRHPIPGELILLFKGHKKIYHFSTDDAIKQGEAFEEVLYVPKGATSKRLFIAFKPAERN